MRVTFFSPSICSLGVPQKGGGGGSDPQDTPLPRSAPGLATTRFSVRVNNDTFIVIDVQRSFKQHSFMAEMHRFLFVF